MPNTNLSILPSCELILLFNYNFMSFLKFSLNKLEKKTHTHILFVRMGPYVEPQKILEKTRC